MIASGYIFLYNTSYAHTLFDSIILNNMCGVDAILGLARRFIFYHRFAVIICFRVLKYALNGYACAKTSLGSLETLRSL